MTLRAQCSVFILLFTMSIVFCRHALEQTLTLGFTNEAYTYVLLIFPLSVSLIYLDRNHFLTDARPNFRIGSALMFLAVAIGFWGMESPVMRTSALMFALVTWLIASVVFCFGTKIFRAFLFPLLFLFLLVPVPQFALSRMVEFLQFQSAFAAQVMFHAIGVPATQDGFTLSIPGLEMEVASACSSIRSSTLLVVTTLLLAHLFLHSWWRKFLLIAASIPLSVVKNGFRIFTIAELGTRYDRGFLTGRLHHQGGVIFWAVAVIALVLLLWVLRKTEVAVERVSETNV